MLFRSKEVFQPHLPVRLPCYDLAPITSFALGRSLRSRTLGAPGFHGLTSGVPDIICCYKGRFLGLEVKLPIGALTELQKRAIARINRAGGIASRVESVADVQKIIAQVDEEEKHHAIPGKKP